MVTSSLKPEKFFILRVLDNVDILLPPKMQDNPHYRLAFSDVILLNTHHVHYYPSLNLRVRRLLQ